MQLNLSKGIKLALITAVISGVSIFINKFAVDAIKPALVFTTSKNLIVGILVLAILLLSKKWKMVKNLKKDETVKLGLIGIIGGSLPFYLFFEGLSKTSAINAALIHKTLVVWVAILGFKFLKEKLNYKQVLAIVILFGSNLVIGGFKGFKFNTGELMILGATLLWAVENVIAKKVLKTVDSDLVTGARMGLGSVALVVFSLIKFPNFVGEIKLSGIQMFWLGATCLSLLGYVLSWYKALKYEKATVVTAVLVSSTLVTNLLSAIFITKVWGMEMGIQALLIIFGIFVFVRESKKVETGKILQKVL